MLYEKKHILTITNDNGKRAYSANAIGKLIDQENNLEGV